MQWYYTIRDDSSRRGLVDESLLFEMAKDGTLSRSDLVWRKDSGKSWIRAELVEGLFPELPAEPPPVEVVEDPPPQTQEPTVRRRKLGPVTWFFSAAAVMAAIALVVVLVAEKMYDEGRPFPGVPVYSRKIDAAAEEASRLQALGSARGSRVKAIADRVDEYLKNEQMEEALAGISELRDYGADEQLISPFLQRLGKLEKVAVRSEHLKQVLRQGALTTQLAQELLDICQMQSNTNELFALVKAMLDDPEFLTPAASLSAMRVSLVAGHTSLLKRSLDSFASGSPKTGSFTEYLEVVNVYCSIGQQKDAEKLLEGYLGNEPEVWSAWLELAALRARANDSKRSLEALKHAVEHGGNTARDKARADSRFTPVRNTRTFKRYVKPEK